MIINMRGTGGSGKSYIGFKLLEDYPAVDYVIALPQTRYNPAKKAEKKIGFVLPGDLIMLGRYEMKKSGAYSGGLEAWGWKGAMIDMRAFIKEMCHKYKHVYFEGLLISLAIKPYLLMAEELTKESAQALPIVFGFLNTPRQVCHDRIMIRNGGKEIDVHSTVNYPFSRHVGSIRTAYEASQFDSPWVPYERSYDWTVEAFKAGGWRP